jgi:hypothetical protein
VLLVIGCSQFLATLTHDVFGTVFVFTTLEGAALI